MDKKATIGIVLAAVVILGGIYWFSANSAGQGSQVAGSSDISTEEKVEFAQCLSDEGATFYGAFWCPHCNDQKALFGDEAMEAINYVECSTPDGNGQTDICIEEGIQSYPTWEFADGSRVTGVQSFEALAERTSCEAPGAEESATSTDETATTSTTTNDESGSVESAEIELNAETEAQNS